MHTVFALLCFVVVIHWLIFPYSSGLLHWHCDNLTIAPVPAKQPWWIWINTSCELIMNDCITTTKQSTTKPCAYFLGYTVHRTFTKETHVVLSFVRYAFAGDIMSFSTQKLPRIHWRITLHHIWPFLQGPMSFPFLPRAMCYKYIYRCFYLDIMWNVSYELLWIYWRLLLTCTDFHLHETFPMFCMNIGDVQKSHKHMLYSHFITYSSKDFASHISTIHHSRDTWIKPWKISVHQRAYDKLTPSQWETSSESNTVSHWLGANLESALQTC